VTPRETTARFAEGLLATRVLAQRVSGASRTLPQRPDQIGSADEDRAFDSDLATTQGYRRTLSHRQLDGLPGKRLALSPPACLAAWATSTRQIDDGPLVARAPPDADTYHPRPPRCALGGARRCPVDMSMKRFTRTLVGIAATLSLSAAGMGLATPANAQLAAPWDGNPISRANRREPQDLWRRGRRRPRRRWRTLGPPRCAAPAFHIGRDTAPTRHARRWPSAGGPADRQHRATRDRPMCATPSVRLGLLRPGPASSIRPPDRSFVLPYGDLTM
jgi:hypothetical protein